jgi:hypothetical protein
VEVGTLTGGTALVSCHSAGSNFSVDLTGLSGDVLIHIYDCATPRTSDIGVVTLTNSSGSIDSVAVFVAGGASGWDETGEFPRDEGCIDFGGLFVANSGMRGLTRASINVAGNLEHNASGSAPDVHVNQIVRLQAIESGGTIAANVTADGGTLFGTGNTLAIGQVRAHNGITGILTASAKDIANVRVVGASSGNPIGLQGNISAASGTITEIWSSGPIGTSTTPIVITAGKRVGKITVRDQATSTDASVLAKHVYATVNAFANPDTSTNLASTSLIETGGNFIGAIHLHNVKGEAPQEFVRASTRTGIFVGGKFEGNITVDKDYSHADMIARSFRGNITIGKFFEGAIVAVGHATPTDSLDGTIGEVSIGRNGIAALTGENLHGFGGKDWGLILQPPFEGSDTNRDRWYTEPPSAFEPVDRIIDSVIRADKSIESITIEAMSSQLYAGGEKLCKPRVEAPVIGSIDIGAMDTGVIWSGKLGNSTPFDISDDYASVGHCRIDCMGPAADIWIDECASDPGCAKIDIVYDCYGEIHVPVLGAVQSIRIGGKFGDLDTMGDMCSTEIDEPDFDVSGVLPTEDSPRGYWADVDSGADPFNGVYGVAPYARIMIQDIAAMEGQVVLNASNASSDPVGDEYYLGDVWVGSGDPNGSTPSPKVFSASGRATETEREGEYYAESRTADGGGAIGVVGYNLHKIDCDPDDEETVCSLNMQDWPVTGGTQARETIIIAHYGPVDDFAAGGVIPFEVERQSLTCVPPACPAPWSNISTLCTVRMGQGTNGRDVWICMTPSGGPVSFGDLYSFRITPRTLFGVKDLRCLDTLLTSAPEVHDYEYNCTVNSLACMGSFAFGQGGEGGGLSGAEYYTSDDMNLLMTVDFNRDGNVDEDDLVILFERLASE